MNFHKSKNDPENSTIFSETLEHCKLPQASSPLFQALFPVGWADAKFVDFSTTVFRNLNPPIPCASPPISFTAYHAVDVTCFMMNKTGRRLRTRFGEHRGAVVANDASQLSARHINSGSHFVSDMVIKEMKCISFSKFGTVHPLGVNEVTFSCI